MVTGKFYVGKHKTRNLQDSYLGSGKLLRSAVAKHGEVNFSLEVLGAYANAKEMDLAERILVVLDPELSLNLKRAGEGGFDWINARGLNWSPEKNARVSGWKKLTRTQRREFSALGNAVLAAKFGQKELEHCRRIAILGLPKAQAAACSLASREKRKETMRRLGHQKGSKNSQFGRPRSEETKRKISAKMKSRAGGSFVASTDVL